MATITTTKTLAAWSYIVKVDGERVGTVKRTNPHFARLYPAGRWIAQADGYSTLFDCDGQGFSTRAGAIDEMVRFLS